MATSKFTVTVEVDKLTLKRIQAKLNPTTLVGADLTAALRETVADGVDRIRGRAPIGRTSVLASSVSGAIDHRSIPLWGKITADASRGGFRYGWALQASKRVRYHYRHGGKTGRLTRRWFTGVKPWLRKRLEARLRTATRRVESRWAR